MASADQTILVTGGAGFIGTHTVVQLLNEGFRVSIIDNLDNSVEEAVERVRGLVGPDLSKKLQFNLGDLRNKEDLEKLFSQTKFDAVIHFAGLKAVGESVAHPLRYFDNNLIGTLNLYEIMRKYGCKKRAIGLNFSMWKVDDMEKHMDPFWAVTSAATHCVSPEDLSSNKNEKMKQSDLLFIWSLLTGIEWGFQYELSSLSRNLHMRVQWTKTQRVAYYGCGTIHHIGSFLGSRKMMVFSSSATVYGQPEKIPCVEDFSLMAMNPYGRTKLFLEDIARDIQKAEPDWRIILLRYFNPVGAHESGKLGEDPKGIPNNLMPYIQQVAVGRLPELNVYGHDYPTKDGSAVRDYIHVMDLADGHIAALRKLFTTDNIGCIAYNLGTGCGTSVLEMVAAFEKASGKKIPIKICPRRPGDATAVYASTEKAERELGWKAKYGIEEMCRDQWNWARNNPWGYQSKP